MDDFAEPGFPRAPGRDGRAPAARAGDPRRAGACRDGRGAAREVRAERRRELAYADAALPIGSEQTISQPWIVAAILQALEPDRPSERVLEVGTGSGYSTCLLLGRLASHVVSVERHPSLARSAAEAPRVLRHRQRRADGRRRQPWRPRPCPLRRDRRPRRRPRAAARADRRSSPRAAAWSSPWPIGPGGDADPAAPPRLRAGVHRDLPLQVRPPDRGRGLLARPGRSGALFEDRPPPLGSPRICSRYATLASDRAGPDGGRAVDAGARGRGLGGRRPRLPRRGLPHA